MFDTSDILPTRAELYRLNRWAIVAFTIRCAQRMFPILEQSLSDQSHSENAAKAILVAMEGVAQGDHVDPSNFYMSLTAPDLADIGEPLFVLTRLCNVAKAAVEISKARRKGEEKYIDCLLKYTALAASAASYASWFAVKVAYSDKQIVAEAIRKDFELLRVLCAREHSKSGNGVDLRLLGPLWTDITPDWYYESELLNPDADVIAFQSLPTLELYFEPGNASKESLQRVMEALSKLHIADGGAGLKFQPGDGFIYVREHVAA